MRGTAPSQLGLRFLELVLVSGRIHLRQDLAGPHCLAYLDSDIHDPTLDLGRYSYRVSDLDDANIFGSAIRGGGIGLFGLCRSRRRRVVDALGRVFDVVTTPNEQHTCCKYIPHGYVSCCGALSRSRSWISARPAFR